MWPNNTVQNVFTHVASIFAIYWNKRKRLHKKDYNSHRIISELQHGRRFIILELQYGRDDVMRKKPSTYALKWISYVCQISIQFSRLCWTKSYIQHQ